MDGRAAHGRPRRTLLEPVQPGRPGRPGRRGAGRRAAAPRLRHRRRVLAERPRHRTGRRRLRHRRRGRPPPNRGRRGRGDRPGPGRGAAGGRRVRGQPEPARGAPAAAHRRRLDGLPAARRRRGDRAGRRPRRGHRRHGRGLVDAGHAGRRRRPSDRCRAHPPAQPDRRSHRQPVLRRVGPGRRGRPAAVRPRPRGGVDSVLPDRRQPLPPGVPARAVAGRRLPALGGGRRGAGQGQRAARAGAGARHRPGRTARHRRPVQRVRQQGP